MKDTLIKGNGKSRSIKAPTDMPATFEEWRTQLLAGTATLDIGLNAAGCEVVGTALSKANLLSDTTKAALNLHQVDPTVDDALYDLSRKTQAVLNVITEFGAVVTATKGSKVLSATADSSGLAVLYPDEFGTWTLKATIDGENMEVPFVIDAIAVFKTPLIPELESASWRLISEFAEAGIADSVWSVGDTKTIKLDGVSYTVQIIGFNHDDKTGGGKAGITFQMVDCLSTTYIINRSGNNSGGWKSSDMRAYLSTLLSQLQSDLQTEIKYANKLVSVGGNSSNIETVSDKLFLLSEVEIFGRASRSFAGEGSQYAWYKAGNTTVKKVNGSAYGWWERSPYSGNTISFCFVGSGGDDSFHGPSNSYGVSFAFCV